MYSTHSGFFHNPKQSKSTKKRKNQSLYKNDSNKSIAKPLRLFVLSPNNQMVDPVIVSPPNNLTLDDSSDSSSNFEALKGVPNKTKDESDFAEMIFNEAVNKIMESRNRFSIFFKNKSKT